MTDKALWSSACTHNLLMAKILDLPLNIYKICEFWDYIVKKKRVILLTQVTLNIDRSK